MVAFKTFVQNRRLLFHEMVSDQNMTMSMLLSTCTVDIAALEHHYLLPFHILGNTAKPLLYDQYSETEMHTKSKWGLVEVFAQVERVDL